MMLFLLLWVFQLHNGQVDPTERLGVKGPLTVGKTEFNLVWTDKPNDKYYVQEYLPAGEKLDSFNEMLTLFVFDAEITLEEAVAQKVQELTLRKKTDATCNYQVNENKDKKEYVVDFIVSETKNNIVETIEFSAYRYKLVNVGNRNALLVYAYSKRAYGSKGEPFLRSLKNDRLDYLRAVTSTELPAVTLP